MKSMTSVLQQGSLLSWISACGEDMIPLTLQSIQMGKPSLCPTNLWRLATPLRIILLILESKSPYRIYIYIYKLEKLQF